MIFYRFFNLTLPLVTMKFIIWLTGYDNYTVAFDLDEYQTRHLCIVDWKYDWPSRGQRLMSWKKGELATFEAWLKEKVVCDY